VRFKLAAYLNATLLVSLCFGTILSQGQTTRVKATFLVDDKETKKPFRIIFSTIGTVTQPTISADGSFSLPMLNAEKVDVSVISGKYNLLYEGLYFNKLAGPLTFQVFTSLAKLKRLSDLDFKCKPGQKLIAAYGLNYGDGTEMFVTTCR